MVHVAVGEAFPTGPAFLLAKSSFPSLKTPTVLSQQELGNPVGKAFTNRVGVFANSLALLAKHTFPVVIQSTEFPNLGVQSLELQSFAAKCTKFITYEYKVLNLEYKLFEST
jgi:hypothetical protein